MEDIGLTFENIGYKMMPLSFIAYFILRILEVKFNSRRISKLVKSIWYIAVAIGSLDGDIKIDQLVIMMIFFDAFDSFMEYREEKKK